MLASLTVVVTQKISHHHRRKQAGTRRHSDVQTGPDAKSIGMPYMSDKYDICSHNVDAY